MIEAALIALLALAVVALAAERARGLAVVTTQQGDSIRGERLPAARWWVIVLKDAELLGGGQKLAGKIEVPRRNVAMLQRLPQRSLQPAARKPERAESSA